jgi:hypothetical protein
VLEVGFVKFIMNALLTQGEIKVNARVVQLKQVSSCSIKAVNKHY